MRYTATVTREDGWWLVRVPELDAVTQATSLDDVEPMARDLIATILDLEPGDVAVDVATDLA